MTVSAGVPAPTRSPGVQIGGQAGIPPELLVVLGLFALPGGYLLVESLRALPAVLKLFGFSGRLGLLFLLLLIEVGCVGASLVGVAWLLFRRDRVGRGLGYLATASVVLAVLVSDTHSKGQVVTAIGAGLAAAILATSPRVGEYLTGAGSRHPDQPTSIVVARVMLLVVAAVAVLTGLLYLTIANLAPRFGFLAVASGAIAVGAVVGSKRLVRADRNARLVVSIAAAAFVLLLLIFGSRQSYAFLIPIGAFGGLIAVLWLPPDARSFFGDPPLGTGRARVNETPIASAGPPSPVTRDAAPFEQAAAPRITSPLAPPPTRPEPVPAPEAVDAPTAAESGATTPRGPLCRSCSAEVPTAAGFCPACGRAVGHDCGTCGHPLPAGSAFCQGCGSPVPAGAPIDQTPPDPPPGTLESTLEHEQPMAVTAAISTDVTSKTADAIATPTARPGCRSCDTALPINTAFCEACGTPTVLRCDACDSPLADGLGFCEACGQATSGNEPASAEPSPNTPEPTTTSANRAAAASATTTRRRQGAIAGGAIGGLAIVAAAVFGIAKLTGGGNDSRAVAVSELSEEGSSQIDQAPPSDPTTAAAPTTGASRLAGLFEPGSVTGGRCFNRLVNSNSYVILNGVRHNSDFVQCGSLHSGRASASYDLSLPLIDGSTGLQFEGLLVVDESTHLPATVTVRVLANGEEFCRGEATYGRPQRLICDLPASAVNAAGLTFEQKVVPNAAGVFAGLLHPEIRAS